MTLPPLSLCLLDPFLITPIERRHEGVALRRPAPPLLSRSPPAAHHPGDVLVALLFPLEPRACAGALAADVLPLGALATLVVVSHPFLRVIYGIVWQLAETVVH